MPPTLTQPGAEEDERGRELAERNTPLDQKGAKPLSNDETAKLGDIEDGLNNNGTSSSGSNSGNKMSSGSGKSGGSSSGSTSSRLGSGIGGSALQIAGRAASYAGRNKKKFGIGGGIAGIFIAAIFGFIALLPLKLESLLANVIGHEFDRVEFYGEKRAEKIVYAYLVSHVTDKPINPNLYVGNSILTTLYGNWQISRFETKLTDKTGLKIVNGEKRGTVRVELADGATLDDVDQTSELAQFLGKGDLAGGNARNVLDAGTQDVTHWFQVLKRFHLRRYLRGAYNISRWGIPKRTDKEATSTDPNAPTITETDVAAPTEAIVEQQDLNAVSDLVGDKAPDVDDREFPDGSFVGEPVVPAENDPDKTDSEVADESAAGQALSESLTEGTGEVAKISAATIIKGSIKAVVTKIMEAAVTKVALKAIPIIGWISFASDVDNFLWNGHLREVTITIHRAEYVSEFSTWASLADQLKAGQLSGTQVNAIMSALSGVEGSNIFQRLYANQNTGQKINPSDGISDSVDDPYIKSGNNWPTCDIGDAFTVLTGGSVGTKPSDPSSADYWTWEYREIASSPNPSFPSGWHQPLCLVHPLLSALNSAVGSILSTTIGAVSDVVDDVVGFFGGGHPLKSISDYAAKEAGKLLIWSTDHMFTPVATGFEVGADLYNAIDAGADVAANGFARDTLGAQALAFNIVQGQTSEINAEQENQLHQQGMFATLFNTNFTQSFASHFLGALPSTPGEAASQVGNASLAAISNPAKFFGDIGLSLFPGSSAADLTADPYGIQQYGFTEAELDEPLQLPTKDIAGPPDSSGNLTPPDGKINEWDCPRVSDPKQPNMCLIDVATAESLGSTSTTANDGGIDGN